VAEAERELQVAAPSGDSVADADDLEPLGVALGDALDHVGDERAGEPVEGAHLVLVVGPGHLQGAVVGAADLDRRRDGVRECALGSLDGDVTAVDGHVDTGRHRDGQASDTRHVVLPYQT
jgi:hypothetical protein